MGIVDFTIRGSEQDDRKLAAFGVEAFSAQTIPYYLRWIREDVVGLFYMISQLRILLILVAIPLWAIAYKMWMGG